MIAKTFYSSVKQKSIKGLPRENCIHSFFWIYTMKVLLGVCQDLLKILWFFLIVSNRLRIFVWWTKNRNVMKIHILVGTKCKPWNVLKTWNFSIARFKMASKEQKQISRACIFLVWHYARKKFSKFEFGATFWWTLLHFEGSQAPQEIWRKCQSSPYPKKSILFGT